VRFSLTTPVEEARFFYNALEIKEDFKFKVSQDAPQIKDFSNIGEFGKDSNEVIKI